MSLKGVVGLNLPVGGNPYEVTYINAAGDALERDSRFLYQDSVLYAPTIDSVLYEYQEYFEYAMAANTDDLALNNNGLLFITPEADDYILSGVRDEALGYTILEIVNASEAYSFLISHEDTNSDAANRFILPYSATLPIRPQEGARFVYDQSIRRWRFIGKYDFTIRPSATPSAPTTGVRLFQNQSDNRGLPSGISSTGENFRLQPSLGDMTLRQWFPTSGGATSSLGINLAFTGSTGTPTVANTNYFTSQNRLNGNGAAVAGNASGGRHNGLFILRGNGNNTGGFYWSFKGGNADAAAVANSRNFAGLYGVNAAIGNVNPSTLLNIVGFGWDTGDANMQLMYNDGAGAATKLDLGANFPANTRSVDWYKHEIWCKPSDTVMYWRLTRWDSAGVEYVTSGSINSNLPDSGTFLSPQVYYGNGTDAIARTYCLGRMLLECSN